MVLQISNGRVALSDTPLELSQSSSSSPNCLNRLLFEDITSGPLSSNSERACIYNS